MIAIDAIKLGAAFGFAVEKLQYSDAVDVLLQIRIDSGDGDANAAIALLDRAAETASSPAPPAASRPA